MSPEVRLAIEDRGIGWNFHWNESSVAKRQWAETYIRTRRPLLFVFFDSHGGYKGECLRLAWANPTTTFIYRHYLTGDRQFEEITPEHWGDEHDEFINGPPNLYCAADNEPPFNLAADWLVNVLKVAQQRRIRVSLAGFGVGQPSEAEMAFFAERLLRQMAVAPSMSIIDCHQYFRALPWRDFAEQSILEHQWPAVIPSGAELHLLGRHRQWYAKADALRLPRPRIAIGEFGPDRVHAVPASVYGDTGGLLHTLMTYQRWIGGTHDDAQRFAGRLYRRAFELFYRDDENVIGVAGFGNSDHPTYWNEFNAHYAPEFVKTVETGFGKRLTDMPDIPAYQRGPHVMKTTQSHINLRDDKGNDIDDIKNNDPVEVLLSTTQPLRVLVGGAVVTYNAQPVRLANGKTGLLALTTSFRLDPVTDRRKLVADLRASNDAQRLLIDRLEADILANG